MKILWITNTIFPAPSRALGIPEPVLGGWMYGLANRIASTESIQLAVATTYKGNELKTFNIDGIIANGEKNDILTGNCPVIIGGGTVSSLYALT